MKNILLMSLYQPLPCLEEVAKVKIHQVENQMEKHLTMTKGNVNFTDYWFATIDASYDLKGKFSGQHFSLLTDDGMWRQGEKGFKDFNEAAEKEEYIGIVLIKIRAVINMPLKEAQKLLERKMKEQEIFGKIYRTFDNADFILLILGKDKDQIEENLKSLREIETLYQDKEDTIYYSFYSLIGKADETEKTAKSKNGETNKDIAYDVLNYPDTHLLTKRKTEEETLCKGIMEKLRNKIESCSRDKNVKWMSYYQALYQIVNLLSQYEEGSKYKDLYYIFFPALQLFIKQLDAGMERLDSDFSNSHKVLQSSNKYVLIGKMENAVSDFIDSMEVLIYHIGVSCANILNVEGRNGLSYDVSIRLSMMYVSALHVIAEVLNDTDYQYQFCLVPLAYSRPRTNILDFGLEPGDRLIRVRISKQLMLSPRALLAILAHEASHYIGGFRKRDDRADYYASIAAIILLEELLPSDDLGGLADKYKLNDAERDIFNNDCSQRKHRLLKHLKKRLVVELKDKNAGRQYYFNDICQDINDIIKKMFRANNQGDLMRIMDTVSDSLKEMLYWQDCSEALLSAYEAEADQFSKRLTSMSTLNNVLDKLSQVQKNFKEIVADLGAILTLELEPDYYLETFLLSESYKPDYDIIQPALINRIAVVNQIMSNKEENWEKKWSTLMAERFNDISFLWRLKTSADHYVIELERAETLAGKGESISGEEADVKMIYETSPFQIKQIVNLEGHYLEECYDVLKNQVNQCKRKIPLKLLRNIYRHFKVYDMGQEPGYADFFEDLKALTDYYKESVKRENREEDEK